LKTHKTFVLRREFMTEPTPFLPTPTHRGQPLIYSEFETLTDALDYAASSDTGFNYFTGKGELKTRLTYTDLRHRAIETAKRLVKFADKDARIGIAATTSPEFAIMFFACQYAGLVPAPIPLPVTLGGRSSYERQLQILTFEEVDNLPQGDTLRKHGPDDLCYIQYSSGSSSSPKGIIGTQSSVAANCKAITQHGLKVTETDRCTSWLPLYHDMGLIGFLITPMMSQMSVDYIDPQDFTRRPITWLQLISDHGGTLSYSPTFGYELCVRRWREDRIWGLIPGVSHPAMASRKRRLRRHSRL